MQAEIGVRCMAQESNLAVQLFSSERLPRRPYCTDDLTRGLRIRGQNQALRLRYIQPNSPALRHWLIFDIDRPGAAWAWENLVAEPNYTVINPDNGYAHLIYGLQVPVVTSNFGRLAPLRYAASVEGAYTSLLNADPGYSGLICKNPFHPSWKVRRGPNWAYDLASLAEWIPDFGKCKGKVKRKYVDASLGRHVALFDELRQWAYRNINMATWISFDAWYKTLEAKAATYNIFPTNPEGPLRQSEIRATAKSVAKWVWRNLRGSQADYVARTHMTEIQTIRGRQSGKARAAKRNSLAAQAQELADQGVAHGKIAELLQVSTKSIQRYLKGWTRT